MRIYNSTVKSDGKVFLSAADEYTGKMLDCSVAEIVGHINQISAKKSNLIFTIMEEDLKQSVFTRTRQVQCLFLQVCFIWAINVLNKANLIF